MFHFGYPFVFGSPEDNALKTMNLKLIISKYIIGQVTDNEKYIIGQVSHFQNLSSVLSEILHFWL